MRGDLEVLNETLPIGRGQKSEVVLGGENVKKGYIGKIKNSGSQVVKAPNQSAVPKKRTVKTGTDLRAGKK
jgi:hypothetical protein